jgi:hypothetical protein
MTPASRSLSNIHIAEIDFPAFYAQVFPSLEASRDFCARVDGLPPGRNTSKIVLHQAARMIWLADQVEKVANGRPAFQILFYFVAAELVAKITFGFEGEGESKKYVCRFFDELCSQEARERLGNAFYHIPGMNLTHKQAVEFLYKIRCDVVHEGKYYAFHLPTAERAVPLLTQRGDTSLISIITIQEIRTIVLEGAVRASQKLMSQLASRSASNS